MTQRNDESWKSRTYMIGASLGALVGMLSAYLFVRSAEENPETGRPEPIKTGTLISLLLAVLALVRQIAESGKSKK